MPQAACPQEAAGQLKYSRQDKLGSLRSNDKSKNAFSCAGRGDTKEQSVGPQLTLGTAAADEEALQKSCGNLCPTGSS